MKPDYEAYAEEIATTRHKTCSWCNSPFHKVQSKGLCSHCYRLCREENRLKEQVDALKADSKNVPWDLLYSKLLVEEMIGLAKKESLSCEADDSFHPGIRIERILNYICKHWVNHAFYSQDASIFANIFSPAQRRALIFLLSRMVREHLRKNRRSIATGRLAGKGIYSIPPPNL